MAIKILDLARQRDALEPNLSAAMLAVLDHGAFINGPEVKKLEVELAEFCGAKAAVACANGTDALELILRAFGCGPDDAVFVPSLTFAATAESVALTGATPVFVDVTLATGNMDPASLEQAIASVLKKGELSPKVVIAVDLFSLPADYAAISALARSHGMKLVADAAQSFGSETPDGMAGTLADASTTSFYPSKSLGCYGDGGAVITNDMELAKTVRGVANHGVTSAKSGHGILGRNSRMDSIQGAVLLEKLAVLADELDVRRDIAAKFGASIGNVCTVPTEPEGVRSAWTYYVIRTAERDRLRAHLESKGVSTVVYYAKPIHLHDAFKNCPVSPTGLRNTEELAGSMLCLPMHPYLTDAEVAMIIDGVTSCFTG